MGKTLLERMCSITKKMSNDGEERGITLTKMDKAKADIRDLSKRLDMSKMQVLILTAVMHFSDNEYIYFGNVSDYLGLDYLEFQMHMEELRGLQKKGYLMIDASDRIHIDKRITRSIQSDKPVEPLPVIGLDTLTLLERIKSILIQREGNVLTTQEAVDTMRALLDQNPDSSLAKGFSKHIFRQIDEKEKEEIMAIFGLIYRYYFVNDDRVGWADFRGYYTEEELQKMRTRYKHRSLFILMKEIIEPTGNDGVRTKDFFHLRDDIKNDMLADEGGILKEEQDVYFSSKLETDKIIPKTLYYNEKEEKQIVHLYGLLSEKRFTEIRNKMKSRGLRTGFTCLFYGAPGTGKTESVYQIARECGRDIFVVEVSRIKSCWVGASEKNIKEVFDNYRTCISKGGTVPILLFNEADAIFGIRPQGAEKAVDKMENSLQNIILQEMENLDGILIATTNLTQNFDKAFERRFLYKLRFDKPSAETRSRIWQSMLPELSETEALQLSREYDFSGGQIENVARKKAVNDILGEKATTFTDIRSFCEEETLAGCTSKRKIGF